MDQLEREHISGVPDRSADPVLARRCLELEQEIQKFRDRCNAAYGVAYTDVSLYYDQGRGFSEQLKLHTPITLLPHSRIHTSFRIPEGTQALRLDPGEIPCYLRNVVFSEGSLLPKNGAVLGHGFYLFLEPDPIFLVIGLGEGSAGKEIQFSCDYYPIPRHDSSTPEALQSEAIEDVLKEIQAAQEQLLQARQETQSVRKTTEDQLRKQRELCEQVTRQRDEYRSAMERIASSFSWKLTAPLRAVGSWVRRT